MAFLARFFLIIVVTHFALPDSNAATLNFFPSGQTTTPGGSISVDVVVDDLGGDFIGSFDVIVNYDSSVLSLSDVVFGAALGSDLDSFQFVTPDAGEVNVVEVSLLSDLSPLQNGVSSFVLFTLTFDAISTGSSLLSFTGGIAPSGDFLADEVGDVVATTTTPGTVAVIPLPVPALLLVSGLVSLLGFARKRQLSNFSSTL